MARRPRRKVVKVHKSAAKIAEENDDDTMDMPVPDAAKASLTSLHERLAAEEGEIDPEHVGTELGEVIFDTFNSVASGFNLGGSDRSYAMVMKMVVAMYGMSEDAEQFVGAMYYMISNFTAYQKQNVTRQTKKRK
ncbi:hypothetical protein KIPB_005632 [Kipferlia bialata]|uniref:Uncharacterized protein n=1 Tax=Kipferlia bialata TaxID=797122 RepID=A0A9K3CXF8_9EUKA|nr:hypothetical protein KIPB_002583 [Kipferlia bialata]GIQ84185.1 hypothetical protein KIPB_005632 [Kipferlia bialata]|eukprot:g2583.t1